MAENLIPTLCLAFFCTGQIKVLNINVKHLWAVYCTENTSQVATGGQHAAKSFVLIANAEFITVVRLRSEKNPAIERKMNTHDMV